MLIKWFSKIIVEKDARPTNRDTLHFMHLLSHQNRSEFLACPQLIRFEYAEGRDGFEPTILIKGSTLLLKYVVLGARMQLAFAVCDGRLLCALQVFDDGDDGGILWSVIEREEELNGICGFARGEPLVAFLFNEIAVNVSWAYLTTPRTSGELLEMASNVQLGEIDHSKIKATAIPMLERLHKSVGQNDEWLISKIGAKSGWSVLRNTFITAGASSSPIDLFESDEGNQQEQIGIWLTDNLQPAGAYHSPQRPYKENQTRELTDILLSHEFGATLIESKALSIFARERLPNRAKLKRDVSKHIKKAFGQLEGAIKTLQSGQEITSPNGEVLSIERKKAAHAIVLIPDLDLIESGEEYGNGFIHDFMKSTNGFPHLMDISELLRMVQAAEIIVAQSKTVNLMMAFDYYLIQRSETAAQAGTLRIEMLLRNAAMSHKN